MEKFMDRQYGKKRAELLLALAAVASMLLALSLMFGRMTDSDWEALAPVTEGWYYMEGDEKVPVTPPEVIEKDGDLELYLEGLNEEDAGKVLCIPGAVYEPRAVMNGNTLYEYEDSLFPRNAQMKMKIYCSIKIPVSCTEGTLELKLKDTRSGRYVIPLIYKGSEGAVSQELLIQSALSVGIELFMILLGAAALGVCVYLRRIQMSDSRFRELALFLLICAVWCFSDSSLIQSANILSSAVCLISFYAFMLLAVPMLHFVKDTLEVKEDPLLDGLTAAFYINAILQGVLNYMGIFEFTEMLFVTHILLLVGVAACTLRLVRKRKEHPTREITAILKGFGILGAGGVLAILLYWLLEFSYYGIIFEVGILIFVLILLRELVMTVADNLSYRAELQLYEKISREDSLTGMENRRAFEEWTSSFSLETDSCANAALVFLKLKYLKTINERFGHNAGDELVIAAARCVENVFADMGKCYRVGGNEFCAVILNPLTTEEEWRERLEQELQQYGKGSRCQLVLACGVSYLRDVEGKLKTISDWKYQADRAMYEDSCRKENL